MKLNKEETELLEGMLENAKESLDMEEGMEYAPMTNDILDKLRDEEKVVFQLVEADINQVIKEGRYKLTAEEKERVMDNIDMGFSDWTNNVLSVIQTVLNDSKRRVNIK